MDQREPQEYFLEDNPTFEQQWQALSENNQCWFARWSQAHKKEVVQEQGVMWTGGHLVISFVDPLLIGDQLDRAMQWYRGQDPLEGAICWYLSPNPSDDIAARLLARGFEPNWQPHWMWCSLSDLSDQPASSTDFDIRIVDNERYYQADDLPYYPIEDREAHAALLQMYPRYVYSLVALQKGQVVGHCILNVTADQYGIGGLFNMGVIPLARRQGIGTVLTREACHLARQRGCRHVMLNATPMGEPVYRRVGFQSMRHGVSWHLRSQTLAAPALTKEQVRFLEAVGRGELRVLDEMITYVAEKFLSDSLPNGLTPLDIAVHCQQPAVAEWLVDHGVPLGLLSAWDLGWKERIRELLIQRPELVNVQRGEGQLTLLHIAVERNDIELVKTLLSVPNDLNLTDGTFKATASGWAQYLQRTEIIALIQQHGTS